MALPQVSGVSSWTMTRDQIISSALRKLGILVDGAVPTTTQLAAAQEALNNIMFTLYAQGMPIWAMTTTFFTPVLGQIAYPVGLGLGSGNLNIQAPLKVTQAFSRDLISNTDIPMNIYTQYNYNLLSTKVNEGYPVHLWYQPGNQQGTITIWPAPDQYTATNRVIYFVYQKPFDQFVVGTDTPDMPQVWIEPLIYSLAHRLGPEYGIPLGELDKFNEQASAMIQNALSFGTEEGALFLQPDWVVMGMGQGNPNGY
jgi:hypothetical protein